MKKSQVLKGMVDIMAQYTGHYSDAEDNAPQVLEYLEKIGMLPPQIDNTYSLPSGSYLSLDSALTRGLREWEPEDEDI